MSTIIVALVLIGFIALIVAILIFIHNRDQKAEAAKNASETTGKQSNQSMTYRSFP
jgi:type II secretory pathway pseudopilin PulG